MGAIMFAPCIMLYPSTYSGKFTANLEALIVEFNFLIKHLGDTLDIRAAISRTKKA